MAAHLDRAKLSDSAEKPLRPKDLRKAKHLDLLDAPTREALQRLIESRAEQADESDEREPVDLPSPLFSPGVSDPASENKSGASPQALALPSGEGAVDGLGESFEPLLSTGTATFSLPIQVPPARGRVQPSLAFSYNSGAGQGIAGMGWNVGVASISRQTDKGVPRYDATDRFAFNGEELVEIAGWPNVPAQFEGARHFRLKLEGRHWRFFYFPGTDTSDPTALERGNWVAQDKDGTTYYFGTSTASAIENDEGIYCWKLSEVIDVHGNRAVYEHFRDLRWVETPYPHFEGNGESYLVAILYNDAADGAFKDRIGFNYEGRPDILTSYGSGYAVRTVRRLESVTVDTEYQEGQERRRVRSYQLSYDQDSYHTLLTSIQLVGNDGVTAYPPLRFEYTRVAGADVLGNPDPTVAIPLFGEFDASIRHVTPSPDRSVNSSMNDLLDIDGDSLPDLFITDLARNASSHTWIKNLDGASFDWAEPDSNTNTSVYSWVTGEQWLPGGDQLTLSNRNVQLLDMDGNGRADMLHMPRTSSYNYYILDDAPALQTWRKCDSYVCGDDANSIPIQGEIDFRQAVPDIRLFDVDNDHLIDVVMTTNGATKVWLNLGGTFAGTTSGWGRFGSRGVINNSFDQKPLETCPLYKGIFIRFSDPRVTLGDMNGDGLQDIVLLDRGDIVYWPGRGYGSFGVGPRWCSSSEVGSNRHLPMGNSPHFSDLNLVAMKVADVNGDNLTDLVEVLADAVRIWLNQGGHAFTEPLLIERTPQFAAFSDRLRSADMNGSGSRDLVWGDAANYRYIDFTGGEQPRLLERIENGLGKVTTIKWKSSTEMDGELGWSEHIPFPVHVVSKVTVSDSMGEVCPALGLPDGCMPTGEYVTEYRYFDPYYDGAEHEFRGFAYAEVETIGDENSPTSISKTWFFRGKGAEDEALKGMAYRMEVLDPASGVVLSTTVNQCTVDALEDEDAPTFVDYVNRPPRVVHQAYVSNSLTFLYDTAAFDSTPANHELTLVRHVGDPGRNLTATISLPGTPEAVTQTSLYFDEYGNQTESLEFGRVQPGFPGFFLGDERYSFTEWARNESTWVHRTTRAYVTGHDTTETYQDTFYCYDYNTPCGGGDLDLGDVTREEVWARDLLNGDRWIVRVENQYDAFGHVVETITGQRQTRTFDYGGPKDRFSIYVSGEHVYVDAATTLSAYAEWEPGFAQISRYEDYNFVDDNLAFTRVEYDALGRVHELYQPHVNVADAEILSGECADQPTVQIEYVLPNPANDSPSPVSSATVFRREAECAAGFIVSVSYVDGLGRVRQTLAESSAASEWVLSGHVTYDAKGGVSDAYQPFFIDLTNTETTTNAPESWPAFHAVDPATPVDYSAVELGLLPRFATTSYDAFSRASTVTYEDRSTSRVDYHALSEDQWDENDTGTRPEYAGTPKTLRRDGLGRLVSVTEHNRTDGNDQLTTWAYQYDPIDDLVTVIDPAGNTKTQMFDSLGRKVQIDDPNAGIWTFEYDNADNLTERVDGRRAKIVYTYDGAARMLTEQYFNESESPYPGMEIGVDYHYDNPACAIDDDPCNARVTGRPASGQTQNHAKGRLSYVLDLTGGSYLSYDARGRVEFRTREVEGDYFTTRMSYDALDREVSLTYPDDTSIAYSYDSRGFLTAVPNFVNLITYTAAGLREQVQYADGASTQRDATYDERLRPASLNVVQASGPGLNLLNEEYLLDPVGNFDEILDLRTSGLGGIAPADRVMTYDALYQLLEVAGRFGAASYAYDEVSNLTKRVVDDGASPTGGEFFEKTPGDYAYGSDCPWPNRPYAVCFTDNIAYAGTDPSGFAWFEYDDSGNMLEAQVQHPGGVVTELRLTWDALGRLTYAEKEEGGTTNRVRFAYDYSGARVFKKVERPNGTPDGIACGQDGGPIDGSFFEETTLYVDATTEVRACRMTKFVFAAGRRVARVVTEDPILAPYGFDPLGQYTFYYHPDHLGSTSTVTDADGLLVNHGTYHPFGSIEQEHTDAAFEQFSSDYKYTDKELDGEIGLIYFGARYYWPELGRWVSADPLFVLGATSNVEMPRALNSHTYVANSPLQFVDPNGLTFVNPTDDELRTLDQLAEIPALKAMIEDLAIDPTVRITFYSEQHLETKTISDENFLIAVDAAGGVAYWKTGVHPSGAEEYEFAIGTDPEFYGAEVLRSTYGLSAYTNKELVLSSFAHELGGIWEEHQLHKQGRTGLEDVGPETVDWQNKALLHFAEKKGLKPNRNILRPTWDVTTGRLHSHKHPTEDKSDPKPAQHPVEVE